MLFLNSCLKKILPLLLAVGLHAADSKVEVTAELLGPMPPPNPGTRGVGEMRADGADIASIEMSGSRFVVRHKGQIGPQWDEVSSLKFGPQGQLAYIGRKGSSQSIVLDEKIGPPFSRIDKLTFSNSGTLAYVGSRDREGESEASVVVGEKPGPMFRRIEDFRFAPQGDRYAYLAMSGTGVQTKSLLFADGVQVATAGYPDKYSFTADGRHFFYVDTVTTGRNETKSTLMRDGQAIPTFAMITNYVVSSDGRSILIEGDDQPAENRGRITERKISFNGKLFTRRISPTTSSSLPPLLSPDGKRFAYVDQSGKGFTVVVDGVSGFEYDSIPVLNFTSDSKHVYGVARKAHRNFFLFDDQESPAFSQIAVTSVKASSLGGKVAAIGISDGSSPIPGLNASPDLDSHLLINGKIVASYQEIHSESMQFSSSGETLALIARPAPVDNATAFGWQFIVNGKSVGISSGDPERSALFLSPNGEYSAHFETSRLTSPGVFKLATHIVLNGVKSKAYDQVLTAVFSPDSRHLAWWTFQPGATGGGSLYINGVPISEFRPVNRWNPKDPDFKRMAGTFTASNTFVFIGSKVKGSGNDGNIYRVTCTLTGDRPSLGDQVSVAAESGASGAPSAVSASVKENEPRVSPSATAAATSASTSSASNAAQAQRLGGAAPTLPVVPNGNPNLGSVVAAPAAIVGGAAKDLGHKAGKALSGLFGRKPEAQQAAQTVANAAVQGAVAAGEEAWKNALNPRQLAAVEGLDRLVDLSGEQKTAIGDALRTAPSAVGGQNGSQAVTQKVRELLTPSQRAKFDAVGGETLFLR